jgi:hypothetical protein
VSVSTERPERGPGGIKREHVVWAGAGLIVLLLGVALAFVLANRSVNNKEKAQLLGQSESGGAVTAIGPLNGTDLTQYVPTRQAALAKASGERVAVVSFSRYVTAAEARAAAGRTPVLLLLAAPPGGAPTVVKGDIGEWAQQQKTAAVAERDQTAELLKTVDDPDFKSFYQSEVVRLNKLIAAVKPDGPVVFAVVVRGPVADLQALARTAGVRLVDVGASAKVSDNTEYHGVRPEQTTTVDQNAPRPF